MEQNQRRKQFYDNYCLQLLTGRFESVKLEDNRVIQVFTPQRENKYPPLSQLIRTKMLQDANISRQQILEQEEMILPMFKMNQEEFKKTKAEKELSKELKKSYKKAMTERSDAYMIERRDMIKMIINPNRLPNWGAGGFVDVLS